MCVGGGRSRTTVRAWFSLPLLHRFVYVVIRFSRQILYLLSYLAHPTFSFLRAQTNCLRKPGLDSPLCFESGVLLWRRFSFLSVTYPAHFLLMYHAYDVLPSWGHSYFHTSELLCRVYTLPYFILQNLFLGLSAPLASSILSSQVWEIEYLDMLGRCSSTDQ